MFVQYGISYIVKAVKAKNQLKWCKNKNKNWLNSFRRLLLPEKSTYSQLINL